MLLHFYLLHLVKELDQSGWTMFSVLERRADWLTVSLAPLESTTVHIQRMLVLDVEQSQYVVKEAFAWWMELLLCKAVLKSVIAMSGALFVMTRGTPMMQGLCADNLGFPHQVLSWYIDIDKLYNIVMFVAIYTISQMLLLTRVLLLAKELALSGWTMWTVLEQRQG